MSARRPLTEHPPEADTEPKAAYVSITCRLPGVGMTAADAWPLVARLASAAGVVATTGIVYRALERAQDCNPSTTSWATYFAILAGGSAFPLATYSFVPSRWSVAVRVGVPIALGLTAGVGSWVLAGLIWVSECSN